VVRDTGNPVLVVVENKPERSRSANHVVTSGPGSRRAAGGGQPVCSRATVGGPEGSGTVTGRHLDDRAKLKRRCGRRPASRDRHATMHKLRDVSVRRAARGLLCVVTGVAGLARVQTHGVGHEGRGRSSPYDQRSTAARGQQPGDPTTGARSMRSAFAKGQTAVKQACSAPTQMGALPTLQRRRGHLHHMAMMAGSRRGARRCEERFKGDGARVKIGG